jgi:prepilin-type N-terminal cleavage/methylation domain-containing protein
MLNIARHKTSGFTFIEVLLAMTLFVIAAIVAVDLTRGSVRATQDLKEVTTATWLLKKTITELETKIEIEGFDKACDKKKEGKFDAPFEKFTWITNCEEIDFKLSQSAAALASAKDGDSEKATQENQLQKMVLSIASDNISKSMRELHAEVHWIQGKKNKRKVDVTTHIARYDKTLEIPGVGSAP